MPRKWNSTELYRELSLLAPPLPEPPAGALVARTRGEGVGVVDRLHRGQHVCGAAGRGVSEGAPMMTIEIGPLLQQAALYLAIAIAVYGIFR